MKYYFIMIIFMYSCTRTAESNDVDHLQTGEAQATQTEDDSISDTDTEEMSTAGTAIADMMMEDMQMEDMQTAGTAIDDMMMEDMMMEDMQMVDMQMAGMEVSNKSFKRGIASELSSEADLRALAPGISWWYNWSPSYHNMVAGVYQDYQMDWVPMTWNGNNPDEIRSFLDQHPQVKYLLTFNEPNFQDQANMTPAYAASIWPIFEEIAEEYDVQLVGPAVNYCGGCVLVDGSPIGSNFTIWLDMFLDEFRTQFNREPRIDFMALHWYDFGLEDQINEIITRYEKPVWLTEFALWRGEDWNTDEFERDWMLDMLAYLEAHPMVYRYAWFTGRRNDFPKINLLADDGVLTPLGQAYIEAGF